MLARSYLFVPGDKPDVLAKAGRRGADALIVDLEDAVAPANKELARSVVAEWLAAKQKHGSQTWIRVNGHADGRRDLELIRPGVDGVMIPKIHDAEEVADWWDRIDGVAPGCSLIVLIETARALRDIHRIAACEGVLQLMIGEADLGADLGIVPDDPVWDSLRADVVVASAAADLEPPIGPVDPDFSSPERLESETRRLKNMGFASRAIIHPAQIEPVHRGFTPTVEELEEAHDLLARHEGVMGQGMGVHVGQSGQMVDEAFVRRARRVVDGARRGT